MATFETDRRPTVRAWRAVDQRLVGLVGAALLIAVLARPMVFGRTFIGWDWYPHQWYVWHQAGSLRANGVPSLFAYSTGVFSPVYAFYGGTLYAVAGILTLIVGDPGSAMVIVFVLGFVAAYGGWYWLARQVGLGVWVAHAPAVLFVTSPYYLALIYATGGFGEFTAVSMIPLLLASATATLRADRLRLANAAPLAISAILFTGSHNVTLVWGSTVLVIVGLTLVAVVPGMRRTLTRRGVLRVLGVAVPAILVNGWFLLPDVVYASQTVIANASEDAKDQLQATMYLVGHSHVLALDRSPSTARVPHYALQLPVLGVAWVLAGIALARLSWRTSWFRAVAVLLLAIVGLYVLMESFSLLWALPDVYNNLQFSYRLESYILLAFAGAVVGVLRLQGDRRPAWWAWALAGVVAWSVVGGVVQLRQQPPSKEPEWKQAAPYVPPVPPPAIIDYGQDALPVMTVDADQVPIAWFSADAEHGDHAEVTVAAAPGTIVRTNIVTMPQLIRIDGGRIVAREPSGADLVQLDDDARLGAARLVVDAARPWPVVGGWVLTLLGLAGLAANAAVIGRAARVRRRAGG
jgi:hypothetical protein